MTPPLKPFVVPPSGGEDRLKPELQTQLWPLVAAMCDGTIAAEELARLESLLRSDEDARLFYAAYMDLHGRLLWRFREGCGDRDQRAEDSGFGTRDSGFGTSDSPIPSPALPISDAAVGAAVELPDKLDAAGPQPLIPPIIIDSSALIHYPLSGFPSSLGGWLFSYAAATVLMGMAILGAWVYKVSHDYPIVEPSIANVVAPQKQPESNWEIVGRITGTADCCWSNPQDAPSAAVPLGRKYELASGLVEITYQTGATVILQGRCTYEVESARGGFLSLGKLTARVERSEVRGQGSDPSPLSPRPFPLFFVRTPTAIVTDLGTEFGVEVDEAGATRSHVFRGKVVLRVAGGDQRNNRPIPLGENESASVEAGQEHVVTVTRAAAEVRRPNGFIRHMPKWLPIKLFSTGVGLKEGDRDPHWQIVARSDDLHFKPRTAMVTALPVSGWLPNNPKLSQWLSTANGPPILPKVTYTFRTTFELVDVAPGTAVVRGKFVADNYVSAIRLNGRQLPVPENSDSPPFEQFTAFSVAEGFVEGTNTLEFDVTNNTRVDVVEETNGGVMGLLVELSGHFLSAGKRPVPVEQGRKEGAAMD